MGLRTALVDRAYIQGKHADTRVVQGRRIYADGESPPIRCRLEVEETSDSPDDGHTVANTRPKLMLDRKDLNGNPVTLNGAMTIRVVSRELGEAVYQVNGEPKPMRKKRRVIGWEASLLRVQENLNPRDS